MLIVSRGGISAVPALEQILENAHPDTNARIHSLWALHGLQSLKKACLLMALQDKAPRVRRAAVQLAESSLASNDPEITKAINALGVDPDPQVATQAFLAYRAAGGPAGFNPGNRPLPLVSAVQDHDKKEALQNKLSDPALATAPVPSWTGLRAGWLSSFISAIPATSKFLFPISEDVW